MNNINSIAQMIDHSLLHPTFTDRELREGCELAAKYRVASVCIKPYAVEMAAEFLKNEDVQVGTVVGFPHGNSRIDVKVQEALQAIADGATEIDIVVNIGKVLSGEWSYVENEIVALAEAAHENNAIIKVIFENDYLPTDEYKIHLCRLCTKAKADFVKTSSGYGFVKQNDGNYNYKGATDHDLRLMRKHCPPSVQVKAAGGIRTLDDVLRVREIGVARVGATATQAILDAAKLRGMD
ncbi:MAG: deoxyribose-phosphate aldolase [Candidatus Omnitrophota bacterium]|jgi:deoxyribose-phosphate aldolase|nr:MAG: deoxyribose-phosphate aldolase [Candidatus Omnitrophota bacterium]